MPPCQTTEIAFRSLDDQERSPLSDSRRLRPILSLSRLTHLELPFWPASNDSYYERADVFLPDLVWPETTDDDERRMPTAEEQIRLTSLTITFPADDSDEGFDPGSTDPPKEWFAYLLNMFNPVNLVLVRVPTAAHKIARLVIHPESHLEDWSQLKRCICIGIIPEIHFRWDRYRELTSDDGWPSVVSPDQDGLPELIVLLVCPKTHELEPRHLLASTCANRIDAVHKEDPDVDGWPMRWDVQFWTEDDATLEMEKEALKRSHSKGILQEGHEWFDVDWRTWKRGLKGNRRRTRLFGLPHEEEGWLSQAWFEKHNLE